MIESTDILFVTCCLEKSRSDIVSCVIDNIVEQVPEEIRSRITVFDNASTDPEIVKKLRFTFRHLYQSSTNVGYWSAIDWWLSRDSEAKYTYIIESDMFHYSFKRIGKCEQFLDQNPDVGSMRLHEYIVAERHLYDKDRPRDDSRRSLWQSHTNKVTGKPVKLSDCGDDIWTTTFLTQLPALNRRSVMKDVFAELRPLERFTELDFQSKYWQRHQRTGILDGGAFHCNVNPYGTVGITGSWTPEAELRQIGYRPTRQASIVPLNEYTVTRIC